MALQEEIMNLGPLHYEYDVHFDAENPDGSRCHFVFPVAFYARALEVQATWFKNYQALNTTIHTSIKPHVPKKAA
jgi:hypothetical protein